VIQPVVANQKVEFQNNQAYNNEEKVKEFKENIQN